MATQDQDHQKRQAADARAAEAERKAQGLPSADRDAGAAQMQDMVDAAEAKGYIGVSPDPTPRENYSVKGVTSGKPTPETDPEMAAKAQRRVPLDHLGR